VSTSIGKSRRGKEDVYIVGSFHWELPVLLDAQEGNSQIGRPHEGLQPEVAAKAGPRIKQNNSAEQ